MDLHTNIWKCEVYIVDGLNILFIIIDNFFFLNPFYAQNLFEIVILCVRVCVR